MNTDGSVGIHIEFSNLDPLVACPPQALRVAAEFRPLSQPLCVPDLCALCASVVRSPETQDSARPLRTEDVFNEQQA